jgi:high-affinity iron transporter
MLAALLIVFREVLEAGLIVGVVLAATEGVAHRGRWISGGIAGGVAGAALLAVFAERLAGLFQGAGQDVFNAAILTAAVLMLSWHVLWMSRHARALVGEMRALGAKVVAAEATLLAMATVVAVAVLREGSEVVLFLYGVASGGGADPVGMLVGGLLGVGGGAAVSWLIYRGLLAIPTARLFSVTNVLVALLAAGMAGQAAAFLVNAGWLPSLGEQVWDTSWLLRDDSLLGRSLRALVGYSDRPMGVQVVAYLVVLAVLVGVSRSRRPAASNRGARDVSRPKTSAPVH